MCSHADIISLSVAGYCCHRRCFLLVPPCSLGSCTGRLVLEVDNGRTTSPSPSIAHFLIFQLYHPPTHSLSILSVVLSPFAAHISHWFTFELIFPCVSSQVKQKSDNVPSLLPSFLSRCHFRSSSRAQMSRSRKVGNL